MRITDEYVFFWRGPFSNWHPCKFVDHVTGVEFANTEAAFMWYKANFFQDFSSRDAIAKESDPKKCKAIGRQIIGFNELTWSIVSFSFMSYVNYLKYSQNPELKQELLDTETRKLVEASPYDKLWGIGMGEDEDGVEDPANWKGANLLGLVLMSVRIMLVKIGRIQSP